MLSDLDFRQALLDAPHEEAFLNEVEKQMYLLSKRQRNSDVRFASNYVPEEKDPTKVCVQCF